MGVVIEMADERIGSIRWELSHVTTELASRFSKRGQDELCEVLGKMLVAHAALLEMAVCSGSSSGDLLDLIHQRGEGLIEELGRLKQQH